MNPHSSVDIVTRPWAGRPKNQGSIPGRSKRFSFSLQRPDQLHSPPSLLDYEYRKPLPGGKATGACTVTKSAVLYTVAGPHQSVR
jgi:hypothetical protein